MSGKPKPWDGRFQQPTKKITEAFSASVHYDRRLARFDIQVSLAHANMLAQQKVLQKKELELIRSGLRDIKKSIESGQFSWDESLEDVHMNIEAALVAKIGDVGKKLHTARSRNDQVATDTRLFVRACIDEARTCLQALQSTIIERAEQEADAVMPGHTHLQVAQPITAGYHLLAWNFALQRDHERMIDCRKRVNVSPLGAAALAGSPYPINPQQTAEELEFEAVFDNGMDAVSDRDFAVEFAAVVALLMVHLSRICEEIIMWSSEYFGFVRLADPYCTGSSIMPQKKNPDIPELVRGKSGRVCGHLNALLIMLKSQPLAYNRDNQEDKEALFDTADTLINSLHAITPVIKTMEFDRDAMKLASEKGYSVATDLADYLVAKGVPFRDAHAMTGKIVAEAIKQNKSLPAMDIGGLKKICPTIDDDVYDVLNVSNSVSARSHHGATAPNAVLDGVKRAKQKLRSVL